MKKTDTIAAPAENTISLNAETSLLIEFLKQTQEPVFLTGKAGTGKTTLLRYIKNNLPQNLAIVAPTAVAALNAGGVTLHSLFQIPFGPIIPLNADDVHEGGSGRLNFSAEKVKLLRCLELLIIDEISMVRADTLDYVDFVLKTINGSGRPFGGVQVLMIGDLYQLPPVANQDWPLLHKYYASPYFFDSRVLKTMPLVTFELTQVYRQSDPVFIEILNGIRNGQLTGDLLGRLNERCRVLDSPTDVQEYITLTTHNDLVSRINRERLENLAGEVRSFKATVSGDFPKDAYPADEDLALKVGAQVMFTKNDSSGKKQYYNGRMAKVTAIAGEAIELRFTDDSSDFTVLPEVWRNVKYALGDGDQQITEIDGGSFTQYPIRLAWAITIHKSQGLTFDKAVVDVSGAFAHGQAYVALSRCRSLEGLILNAPVEGRNLITDPCVIRFMSQAVSNSPDQNRLKKSVLNYERSLVEEVFNFTAINGCCAKIGRLLKAAGLPPELPLVIAYEQINTQLQTDIIQVAARFIRREVATLSEDAIENQPAFLARLQKAAGYFRPKVEQMTDLLRSMVTTAWPAQVPEADLVAHLDAALNGLVVKHAVFKVCEEGFNTESYLAAKKTATTSYTAVRKSKPMVGEKPPAHPQLYDNLLMWRKASSEQKNVADHTIMADKTLRLIAEKLPRSVEQLAAIKSIGPAKAKLIGNDVMRVVNQYLGADQLF